MTTRKALHRATLELLAAGAALGAALVTLIACIWARDLTLSLAALALVILAGWLADRVETAVLDRATRA